MGDRPVRITIADDHALVRLALRRDLEEHGFVVCAEGADAAAAVVDAARERPDLCLLDVHMPGSGIHAAWEITASVPETRVVMLTVARDEDVLFASLRAGARGYVLKDVETWRLRRVLLGILDGDLVFPRRLVGRVIDELRTGKAARRPSRAPLASGDWRLLELLEHELETEEISTLTGIPRTEIAVQLASLFDRLRMSAKEAADLAVGVTALSHLHA